MTTGPVVVAILSHRDPVLLRRLTGRVLEGRDTVVVLHHDPRGEPHGLDRDDRLIIDPNAAPADWGRLSLARSMFRCLEVAVAAVPDLSWLLLVSGQDYPVRHMRSVERQLAETHADALLRHFEVRPESGADIHPWQAVCRRRYLHRLRVPASRRSVPFTRRHPFREGTSLYVGDMWVNLGARAVHHVLQQRRELPQIESYLGRCAVPDEALLPTLLLNGAGHLSVLNERRRFIKWTPDTPHPAMLSVADLPDILASDAFFARKVDSVHTAAVLDALDDHARPA